jgi:hypothetical protein
MHLLPIDVAASREARRAVAAFAAARRFPSDPDATVLERNDLCVVLRSDVGATVGEASSAVLELLRGIGAPTSVRRGFVGGGLPRRLALAAGVPGADEIPEGAQMFLGFTSTQTHGLGLGRIANFETVPGVTDQWPDGYFRHGTTMHLSHLREDLVRWYENIYVSRAWTMFRPDRNPREGLKTLSQGPQDLSSHADVLAGADSTSLIGHSASMQPVSRLRHAVVDRYGQRREARAAILQRADANTLDNPFAWTSDAKRDRWSAEPAAGVHFVSFSPTTGFFDRVRLAMDCHYAGRKAPEVAPRAERLGINGAITTTHRQNFLVPPRARRSFPLVELL